MADVFGTSQRHGNGTDVFGTKPRPGAPDAKPAPPKK